MVSAPKSGQDEVRRLVQKGQFVVPGEPWPPYSFGHVMPAYPPSNSRRCSARLVRHDLGGVVVDVVVLRRGRRVAACARSARPGPCAGRRAGPRPRSQSAPVAVFGRHSLQAVELADPLAMPVGLSEQQAVHGDAAKNRWRSCSQVKPIPANICAQPWAKSMPASATHDLAMLTISPASSRASCTARTAAAVTALLASRDRLMSASWCFTAWKEPMGRPKAVRSMAYGA